MFVLPPLTATVPLFLSNSMQFIFMPFSEILNEKLTEIFGYDYPDSLSLTLCIKVASVLAIIPKKETMFVFNIYEPIFDGLKP